MIPRPSNQRGQADHGWLKSFHTFSFANYMDYEHSQFGALRVINEDRVAPGGGFPTHAHANFEIYSYVVSGELAHKDSIGNTEVLKRGDLQLTTAGTGVRHSEFSHGDKEVHFLQIWCLPSQRNLKPQYITRHFTDEQKKDKWCLIVAPTGTAGLTDDRDSSSGAAPLNSPVSLRATLLLPSSTLTHTLPAPTAPGSKQPKTKSLAYVHVVQTSGYNHGEGKGAAVKVTGENEAFTLREGDGLYVTAVSGEELKFENVSEGGQVAEVLLFDVEDI